MDSSQGPQSNGNGRLPHLNLHSPEPALPALLIHQGRTAPKVGVRVEDVNKSVPGPPGKLGNSGTTGGSLIKLGEGVPQHFGFTQPFVNLIKAGGSLPTKVNGLRVVKAQDTLRQPQAPD